MQVTSVRMRPVVIVAKRRNLAAPIAPESRVISRAKVASSRIGAVLIRDQEMVAATTMVAMNLIVTIMVVEITIVVVVDIDLVLMMAIVAMIVVLVALVVQEVQVVIEATVEVCMTAGMVVAREAIVALEGEMLLVEVLVKTTTTTSRHIRAATTVAIMVAVGKVSTTAGEAEVATAETERTTEQRLHYSNEV